MAAQRWAKPAAYVSYGFEWARKPCYICRKGAFLRHPDTGRPCHKVCVEMRAEKNRSS